MSSIVLYSIGIIATLCVGIDYYILKTSYIEINDGRDDIRYNSGSENSSSSEQSGTPRREAIGVA